MDCHSLLKEESRRIHILSLCKRETGEGFKAGRGRKKKERRKTLLDCPIDCFNITKLNIVVKYMIRGEIMINTLIVILFCLASIIVCFFSRMWSWIILAIPFVYLISQAFLVKFIYKWKHIPELSNEANRLFQKYGHYYAMPFAGRDFSSASSAVGITGMVISIIGLFFQFWWGILPGLMSLWFGNRLGKFYNPSMFLELLSDTEKQAHEEIMSYLVKKIG
jgi:hypothetical protein